MTGLFQIQDAWIKNQDGEKVVDWKENNLHVVGYSEPIHQQITFDALLPKLHCLESLPGAIPYRTSYYRRDWGFCVTRKQQQSLRNTEGELEILIESSFDPQGSMTVGEILIPGKKKEEFLVSTYICHPSMANDNLSGLITTALLARNMLSRGDSYYSWRFIFVHLPT